MNHESHTVSTVIRVPAEVDAVDARRAVDETARSAQRLLEIFARQDAGLVVSDEERVWLERQLLEDDPA